MHSVALGVIDCARARQRRRLGIAAAIVASASVIFGVIVGPQGNLWPSRAPTVPVPSRVAPATVFSQAPDMGVACHSGSCDSIGLAVWLRRPAVSVSATIAGHPFALTTWQAKPFAPQTPRKMFVGYLTPLRLVTRMRLVGPPSDWATPNGPDPLVSLRITYRGGRVDMTRLRVPVQPGWG